MTESVAAVEEPKAEPDVAELPTEPDEASAVEPSAMETTTAEASAPAPTLTPVDLSTKWEIAAVTFYGSCFHKLWHLPHVYAEDIEDGCNAFCEDLASQFFLDFFIALLQSFRKCVEINRDNYQIYLGRIATEAGKGDLLSRFADQSFWALPALSRLELLMALCLARIDVDVNNPEGKLKDIEAGQLRMEPLGEDSKGQIYWYFGDTRLYRDVPPPPPPPPPKKKATPKAKPKRRTGGRSRRGKRKRSVSPEKNNKSANESMLDASVVEKPPDPPVARWELVCSTEDQWQSFFADLSSSQKKEDVELYSTMSERILPTLQELFAEKERVMKKRILMMAPRRQSYRLEEKRKAFVEAQRYITYITSDGQVIDDGNGVEEVNGTPDTSNNGDSVANGGSPDHPKRKFRRPPLTNEELLERKRQAQEEKERIRQEAASARANRANRRAEGLPASGLEDGDHTFDDEDSEDAEADYFRMEEILLGLTKHQDAPPFVEPVPTSLAPDYYDIIKCPMDLNVMSRKLMQRQYTDINELTADFEQLCQNCVVYNGPSNPYTTRVKRLSRCFQGLLRQNFPQAAKERIERGYIGQIQHPQATDALSHHQYSRHSEDFDTSATGDTTSLSSPDVTHAWNGGHEDPDWSPSHHRPERGSEKPPKPRRRKNPGDSSLLLSPDGGATTSQPQEQISSGYSQFCNNLDQLLGTEVDNQLVSGAVHEMVSIRAKSSPKKRRASMPLQPKPSDFIAGYQQPPQPRPRAQRSPRQPASQPRPRQPKPILPNSAASTMPHNYHQPNVATTHTVTVLKQTPTGLTSMPGAYFRPTIGEPPPPIRRVTSGPIAPANTPNSANGLRSLLLNGSSGTVTTTTISVPANSTPTIRLKLVTRPAGSTPTPTQQNQTQPAQQLAYVVPISLPNPNRAPGSATVFFVHPQAGQQFSVARVQGPTQVHCVPQQSAQPTPTSVVVQQAGSANSVTVVNHLSTSTPGTAGTNSTGQGFNNAFVSFVASSSRV